MENIIEKQSAPRSREMQETINHLILGITMWVSATLTCVTTLLTTKQPWCLVALLIPFIYTMFPQIQKFTAMMRETAVVKYKEHKEHKAEKVDKKQSRRKQEETIEEQE